MNTQVIYARVVDVYVRDRQDRPVASANISFSLNGTYAGEVANSGGHGSIRLTNLTDVVGVSVKYRGYEEAVTLEKNARNYTFRLPTDSGFLENHLGMILGFILWGVSIILAFAVGASDPLQKQLVKGTFSLGCGAMATEISGLIDIRVTTGQKFLIAASGALAVFVLLYLVEPA